MECNDNIFIVQLVKSAVETISKNLNLLTSMPSGADVYSSFIEGLCNIITLIAWNIQSFFVHFYFLLFFRLVSYTCTIGLEPTTSPSLYLQGEQVLFELEIIGHFHFLLLQANNLFCPWQNVLLAWYNMQGQNKFCCSLFSLFDRQLHTTQWRVNPQPHLTLLLLYKRKRCHLSQS